MPKFRHLKYKDRIKIEALLTAKHTVSYIASIIGVTRKTIYNEIKRGQYQKRDYEYRYIQAYSADIAQQDYDYKQTAKGAPLKIGTDHLFAKYIEDMISRNHYSPDALIGHLRAKQLYFDTSICTRTLYNYIDRGLFLNISNKHLPQRGKRRKHKHNNIVRIKKPLNRCIDERPRTVNDRMQFGHWEIDTIIGKQGTSTVLLVLTERKTRYEFIVKLKSKSQEEVKKALIALRKLHPHIFLSVTCDNGSEFINQYIIESALTTTAYYCHPNSAWERGTNENANSIIRRFVPKGSNIGKYTKSNIAYIQDWMNNYPRKILHYQTAKELFTEEIRKFYQNV